MKVSRTVLKTSLLWRHRGFSLITGAFLKKRVIKINLEARFLFQIYFSFACFLLKFILLLFSFQIYFAQSSFRSKFILLGVQNEWTFKSKNLTPRKSFCVQKLIPRTLIRNVHEITSTTFYQDSDNKGIANYE